MLCQTTNRVGTRSIAFFIIVHYCYTHTLNFYMRFVLSQFFEEIDYQQTSIGPISLRRRRELRLDVDVLEILLGDEHLMSDLFTASEIELATRGLAIIEQEDQLDVVVGGLGMGFTANAVLDDHRVKTLLIVEKLAPVVSWHRKGLIPLGRTLSQNPAVRFVEGDFFAMASSEWGFDPQVNCRKFDAILLDIDHSPYFHLAPSHASFYSHQGLTKLKGHLRPNGVFALWSNDLPDRIFVERLKSIFNYVEAVEINFHNPLQDCEVTQSVYLAKP